VKSHDELLTAYARLAVRVGVNLQPGQVLLVNGFVEHAPMARALAAEAYAAGARYVDVVYGDQQVRRAHIEGASDEMLDWSPPWVMKRLGELGDGAALVAIVGNPDPEAFAGLDGARIAGARMSEAAALGYSLTAGGRCNWTVVAQPNEGWAQTIFGEPDVDRLWEAVAAAARLDDPDPVESWRLHVRHLQGRADALNSHRFDALRYRGPGTDLTTGLHPDSKWIPASAVGQGIEYLPNLPTEEVFTAPDARRADGVVSATYPFELQGALVKGLRLRFEDGRAVEAWADQGEELIRTHIAADDGAARLGELALVDNTSRVGQTGLVFFNTLFDENAASHIALGLAVDRTIPRAEGLSDEERHAAGINQSTIHTDFMIGSREVAVSGVTREGAEVPILEDGDWVL
jgi:aminopeptidase